MPAPAAVGKVAASRVSSARSLEMKSSRSSEMGRSSGVSGGKNRDLFFRNDSGKRGSLDGQQFRNLFDQPGFRLSEKGGLGGLGRRASAPELRNLSNLNFSRLSENGNLFGQGSARLTENGKLSDLNSSRLIKNGEQFSPGGRFSELQTGRGDAAGPTTENITSVRESLAARSPEQLRDLVTREQARQSVDQKLLVGVQEKLNRNAPEVNRLVNKNIERTAAQTGNVESLRERVNAAAKTKFELEGHLRELQATNESIKGEIEKLDSVNSPDYDGLRSEIERIDDDDVRQDLLDEVGDIEEFTGRQNYEGKAELHTQAEAQKGKLEASIEKTKGELQQASNQYNSLKQQQEVAQQRAAQQRQEAAKQRQEAAKREGRIALFRDGFAIQDGSAIENGYAIGDGFVPQNRSAVQEAEIELLYRYVAENESAMKLIRDIFLRAKETEAARQSQWEAETARQSQPRPIPVN